ncbi:MAG: hypothetical protein OWS74_08180, partial [Firmicutes bacterium]|nr:hypothetical protein [Bacillota bacterium]
YATALFFLLLSLSSFIVLLRNYLIMSLKYEILKVECKENNCFVTVKLIRNGTVEIFNSVPIENINKLIENFSFF